MAEIAYISKYLSFFVDTTLNIHVHVPSHIYSAVLSKKAVTAFFDFLS